MGALFVLVGPTGAIASLGDAASSPLSPSAPVAVSASNPQAAPFNPPCYPINAGPNNTGCVSVQYPTDPQIIPNGSSRQSSVLPNPNQTIHLVVKTHKRLDFWNNPKSSGLQSPVFLNVSARLWNGDPWLSAYDYSVYHSSNQAIWWTSLGAQSTDPTFPYWYLLIINATIGRSPLWYPGTAVSWYVVVTQNLSNRFTYYEGPVLHYTYANAWPYSPIPGSPAYGGPNSSSADLYQTLLPTTPNWNDSLLLALNTTLPDHITRAQIGKAWADLVETAPNGTRIAATTLFFPTPATNTTLISIPTRYSQVEGATIVLRVTAYDLSPLGDKIVLAPLSYTVNGNGSFATGVFDNDLMLTTNPTHVLTDPIGTAVVNPGQPVGVILTSRNSGTAVSAAEIVYQFSDALTNGTQTVSVACTRISSTEFLAYIPGLPLGGFVNFTVLAWDFGQHLEISDRNTYSTPTLEELITDIPANATFFYVLVYDNGTQSWVSNAQVAISGPSGFYNSIGRTTFGIGYPNVTTNPYYPLLLPVNTTYRVSVAVSGFAPGGSKTGGGMFVNLSATHAMAVHATLVRESNYVIAEQGNIIFFWLNATPPSITTAAGVPLDTIETGATIGLVALLVATMPIVYWWREIRARRLAEEKRITL